MLWPPRVLPLLFPFHVESKILEDSLSCCWPAPRDATGMKVSWRGRQEVWLNEEKNKPQTLHPDWVLTTSSPGASVFDSSRIPPLYPVSSNGTFSVLVEQTNARSKTAREKIKHHISETIACLVLTNSKIQERSSEHVAWTSKSWEPNLQRRRRRKRGSSRASIPSGPNDIELWFAWQTPCLVHTQRVAVTVWVLPKLCWSLTIRGISYLPLGRSLSCFNMAVVSTKRKHIHGVQTTQNSVVLVTIWF